MEVDLSVYGDPPLMQGALVKCGWRWKSWKARWFVLDGAGRKLFYFTDKKGFQRGKPPKGVIVLAAHHILERNLDQTRFPFCFSLGPVFMGKKDRFYQIVALAEDELNSWMDILTDVTRNIKREQDGLSKLKIKPVSAGEIYRSESSTSAKAKTSEKVEVSVEVGVELNAEEKQGLAKEQEELDEEMKQLLEREQELLREEEELARMAREIEEEERAIRELEERKHHEAVADAARKAAAAEAEKKAASIEAERRAAAAKAEKEAALEAERKAANAEMEKRAAAQEAERRAAVAEAQRKAAAEADRKAAAAEEEKRMAAKEAERTVAAADVDRIEARRLQTLSMRLSSPLRLEPEGQQPSRSGLASEMERGTAEVREVEKSGAEEKAAAGEATKRADMEAQRIREAELEAERATAIAAAAAAEKKAVEAEALRKAALEEAERRAAAAEAERQAAMEAERQAAAAAEAEVMAAREAERAAAAARAESEAALAAERKAAEAEAEKRAAAEAERKAAEAEERNRKAAEDAERRKAEAEAERKAAIELAEKRKAAEAAEAQKKAAAAAEAEQKAAAAAAIRRAAAFSRVSKDSSSPGVSAQPSGTQGQAGAKAEPAWTPTREQAQVSAALLRVARDAPPRAAGYTPVKPADGKKMTGKDALLQWCKQRAAPYGVEIRNFTTSWKDGLAFCALIHSYEPTLFDFESLSPENDFDNLALAFESGEEIGLESYLDPEDIVELRIPDSKSIMTYLLVMKKFFLTYRPRK